MFTLEYHEPISLQEIVIMVSVEQKTNAIKAIRTEFGWGLRDSKLLIDLLYHIWTGNAQYIRIVDDRVNRVVDDIMKRN